MISKLPQLRPARYIPASLYFHFHFLRLLSWTPIVVVVVVVIVVVGVVCENCSVIGLSHFLSIPTHGTHLKSSPRSSSSSSSSSSSCHIGTSSSAWESQPKRRPNCVGWRGAGAGAGGVGRRSLLAESKPKKTDKLNRNDNRVPDGRITWLDNIIMQSFYCCCLGRALIHRQKIYIYIPKYFPKYSRRITKDAKAIDTTPFLSLQPPPSHH